MIVTLLGKRWRLKFVPVVIDEERPNKRLDGLCDPDDWPRKTIQIRDSLRGQERLETLIHEMLHGCQWFLTEEWVTDAARDIARELWRLGYRDS